MARRKQTCAICGKKNAGTRDHIPPKAIFLKPRPSNMVTVPACLSCNRGASRYDEEFAAMLGLELSAKDDPRGRQLSESVSTKVLKRNRKLREKVVGSAELVRVHSKGGVYLGDMYKVPWESESHDKVIERTVRGLYYYHFNEVVPSGCRVKVQWLKQLDEELVKITSGLELKSVSGNDFLYKYGRAESDPRHSIWFFQFYSGKWSSGYTEPEEI